jgi:hypothetical protein
MESILLALNALATLVRNPALGGGGIRAEENVRLLAHLMQLIQGGQRTAQALKEFAERIAAMAAAGQVPVERDFAEFTARLDAAMTIVEEARAKVEARKPPEPEPEPQPDPEPELPDAARTTGRSRNRR